MSLLASQRSPEAKPQLFPLFNYFFFFTFPTHLFRVSLWPCPFLPKLIVLRQSPLSACSSKGLIYFTTALANRPLSRSSTSHCYKLMWSVEWSVTPVRRDPFSFSPLSPAASDHGWQHHRTHTHHENIFSAIHMWCLSLYTCICLSMDTYCTYNP